MVRRRTKLIALGTAVAAVVAAGAGIAVATTPDDDRSERSITGDALRRASDAALAHVGEGRVTDTEVGDEESLYEVEVTLDDGARMDVQLDADFNVVGAETEGDDEED